MTSHTLFVARVLGIWAKMFPPPIRKNRVSFRAAVPPFILGCQILPMAPMMRSAAAVTHLISAADREIEREIKRQREKELEREREREAYK
jgi:hypothetical protein